MISAVSKVAFAESLEDLLVLPSLRLWSPPDLDPLQVFVRRVVAYDRFWAQRVDPKGFVGGSKWHYRGHLLVGADEKAVYSFAERQLLEHRDLRLLSLQRKSRESKNLRS